MTRQTMLEAIHDSYGIVSRVAERIEKDWATARKYINKWEETRTAFVDEAERVTDVAESRLIKSINDGEQWAVKFWLTTKGKNRGFTERQELSHMGPGGSMLTVKWVDADED